LPAVSAFFAAASSPSFKGVLSSFFSLSVSPSAAAATSITASTGCCFREAAAAPPTDEGPAASSVTEGEGSTVVASPEDKADVAPFCCLASSEAAVATFSFSVSGFFLVGCVRANSSFSLFHSLSKSSARRHASRSGRKVYTSLSSNGAAIPRTIRSLSHHHSPRDNQFARSSGEGLGEAAEVEEEDDAPSGAFSAGTAAAADGVVSACTIRGASDEAAAASSADAEVAEAASAEDEEECSGGALASPPTATSPFSTATSDIAFVCEEGGKERTNVHSTSAPHAVCSAQRRRCAGRQSKQAARAQR
jgi:hypothetical protein